MGEFYEDEGGDTCGVAPGMRLDGFDIELDGTAINDEVGFLKLYASLLEAEIHAMTDGNPHAVGGWLSIQ